MKITIELSSDELTSQGWQKLVSLVEEVDPTLEFRGAIRRPEPVIEDDDEPADFIELDENEIDELVEGMHRLAVETTGRRKFKVSEIYRRHTGRRWNALHPNSRKAMGRRFKRVVADNAEGADSGDPIVEVDGTSVQGSAIYKIVEKE